nr:protein NRT1/ PTR FAMILY 2.13-like [Aegilops tauschii subsp. strangulata]
MAAPGAAAEVEVEVGDGALERGTGGGGGGGSRRGGTIATFENVGSLGVVANLTVYLVKRFNFGQLTAINTTSIFFGTLNFAPLLGAFISDAYLGRFRTLAYGSFFSLLMEYLLKACRIQYWLKFLNKGAILRDGDINDDGSARNSWELCSIQQIEEVKCLIRIVPICISGIVCFVALVQQYSSASFQALTMDCNLGTHFEIPAGSVISISFIALTAFLPIYDRILVPIARRFTGVESGITLLQRQGIGLVISPISTVVAGLVEHKRRNSALSNGGKSPMSVFWLAPQLILMGIADAFNAVGQLEFYNKQFPEHMLTLAGSLFYVTLAGAGYLSAAMTNITKKVTTRDGHRSWIADDINLGKLDYYFYLIALMGVLNLFYFLICSHYYQYKSISHYAEEPIKIQTKEEAEGAMDPSRDAPNK